MNRRAKRAARKQQSAADRAVTAIYDAAHSLPKVCSGCRGPIEVGTGAKIHLQAWRAPNGAPLFSIELLCRTCYGRQAAN